MAFHYERVFVVLDENGEIQGIYKKENNAIDSLPESKRNFPQEVTKFGDWQYGKGSTAWRITERKIKDSADILST